MLSRGKCRINFFTLRKEILKFLKVNIKTDTTDVENQIVDKPFLCSLAFLTDVSLHLNKPNLQLESENSQFFKLFGLLQT